MIIKITETNQALLFEARLQVDGPFKDEVGLKQEVAKYASHEDLKAFVFVEGGKPVGYVECKFHENETPAGSPPCPILDSLGHIARIGVRKENCGNGIGKKLLATGELWLRSLHLPGVWLDYKANNFPANKMYPKKGYVDIAEFPDRENRLHKRRIAVKQW